MTNMAYTQRVPLDFTKFAKLTKNQKHFESVLRYKEQITVNCHCCYVLLYQLIHLLQVTLKLLKTPLLKIQEKTTPQSTSLRLPSGMCTPLWRYVAAYTYDHR